MSLEKEAGNILFILLAVIVLLAVLTRMIASSTEQQSDIVALQTRNDQVSRLLTHAGTLGNAVHQMVINGENPATLYSSLSQLKPGDAGFETAPHGLKLYHPLGGGVTYMAASAPGSNAVATDFNINAASIVTGVGATDITVGDIIFTAKITEADYCQRINKVLTGSTAVPVMATATFNALFTAGTTVTLDGTNCASCVNVARLCVSNTGASAWGFYAALLPG